LAVNQKVLNRLFDLMVEAQSSEVSTSSSTRIEGKRNPVILCMMGIFVFRWFSC
ncbi:MAG: hypothetical protein ACI865_001820, partial [Flavobacteriaceae bacterium]